MTAFLDSCLASFFDRATDLFFLCLRGLPGPSLFKCYSVRDFLSFSLLRDGKHLPRWLPAVHHRDPLRTRFLSPFIFTLFHAPRWSAALPLGHFFGAEAVLKIFFFELLCRCPRVGRAASSSLFFFLFPRDGRTFFRALPIREDLVLSPPSFSHFRSPLLYQYSTAKPPRSFRI